MHRSAPTPRQALHHPGPQANSRAQSDINYKFLVLLMPISTLPSQWFRAPARLYAYHHGTLDNPVESYPRIRAYCALLGLEIEIEK
jgi:hypothetical protein